MQFLTPEVDNRFVIDQFSKETYPQQYVHATQVLPPAIDPVQVRVQYYHVRSARTTHKFCAKRREH